LDQPHRSAGVDRLSRAIRRRLGFHTVRHYQRSRGIQQERIARRMRFASQNARKHGCIFGWSAAANGLRRQPGESEVLG
jgi:hypothetical protein